MAYAIKVLLPGESDPEAALVPVALLANHSLRPDIVRFSRVDADDVLRLRVIRHVAEGAELTLSYGASGRREAHRLRGSRDLCPRPFPTWGED